MRVIISGGGTAGHVYPGLALAKALQKARNDIEILYVGTKTGLEAELVPKAGFEFKTVDARGLPRKLTLRAVWTFVSAGKGMLEARRILKSFRPDAVVGVGAYASLPMVWAARMRRIPTVIHEQNAVPGLVNRVLGPIATAIAISYPDTEHYFPRTKRIAFTGNPIREEVLKLDKHEAVALFDVDESRKVLLVFGGSRGAQRINEAVVGAYDAWRHDDGLQIIHATGKINYEQTERAIDSLKSPEDSLIYRPYPYIDNMDQAYAVADLLVCRSGATTVAEITAIGLPAILIPYPYATDNHQEKNARELEKLGAAKVILDKDLDGRSLREAVGELLSDDAKLAEMAAASRGFGRPHAADELAELVIEVAASKRADMPKTKERL